MKRTILFALALAASPLAALAMPVVGDIVGTDATAATAALAEKGCTVTGFEAENGQIEAKCTDDATGTLMEVAIDPATGAVTNIKSGD